MRFIISLMFFTIFGLAQAQPENFKLMTATQKSTAASNIAKKSQSMKSLQCSFSQERTSSMLTEAEKASGKMLYKQPDKLKCEFTQPKSFVFILNGTKIIMKADGKTKDFNGGRSKIFKSMTEMIVGFVNGSEIQNSEHFSCAYYSNGKQVLVKMTPVKKELKKIYSSVEMYFNADSFLAEKIVMKEPSGDITKLVFSDTKPDIQISDKSFE
ncbi:MAG: outer membrane lipoprotein carrier protein LolA [Bacteroidales bacterium]|nr:outer membrane lipoprotein carrier protein LolA [Bacteroidales bacterium]